MRCAGACVSVCAGMLAGLPYWQIRALRRVWSNPYGARAGMPSRVGGCSDSWAGLGGVALRCGGKGVGSHGRCLAC